MSGTTVVHSPALGIRVSLVAPGLYVCDVEGIDSGVFTSATEAVIFGLETIFKSKR